jgi:hypothetical protein
VPPGMRKPTGILHERPPETSEIPPVHAPNARCGSSRFSAKVAHASTQNTQSPKAEQTTIVIHRTAAAGSLEPKVRRNLEASSGSGRLCRSAADDDAMRRF